MGGRADQGGDRIARIPHWFDRPQLYVRLLGKMKLAQRCGVSAGVLMDWNTSLARSPNGVWSGYQLGTVAAEVKSGVPVKALFDTAPS